MTKEQQALVDKIKRVCNENYERGGDTIIECYTDEDILRDFESVEDAREFCGLRIEQETNARWGEDDDPALARSEAYESWREEGVV